MKLAKVKDHPHLVKDMESKAVLNTNYAAFLEYKKRKQMEEDFTSLKTDVQELKIILQALLNK
jgi:superfamily II helicase